MTDVAPLPILGVSPVRRVALIGQPNCGKSTIFNCVAGYRSETSNFAGSTVNAVKSCVRVGSAMLELVDLPGIFSLTAASPAEAAARQFLLNSRLDLIINVIDASLLSRSLELTLELLELEIPMVVCLNMADEAATKGVTIDAKRLEAALGVPVVHTIAIRGEGIPELFTATIRSFAAPPRTTDAPVWSRDVEHALAKLRSELQTYPPKPRPNPLPLRLVAIKLLEGDAEFASGLAPQLAKRAERVRHIVATQRGRPPQAVVMSERHDQAMRISEEVSTVGLSRPDFRTRIDHLVANRIWGYVVLIAVMATFFWAVFGIGSAVETVLQNRMVHVYARIAASLAPGSLAFTAVRSLWDGFVGGAAIVLPYLVPFLIGLAVLEDVGYLPRVAYLLDGLLHRVGLHGTSMLPLVLGYGCSVPACLATRVLPSRRDRFLASVLATLVPCSARSNVIFALVAFYLGPAFALAIFGVNAVVVVFSGWFLSRMWPELAPGMVLDVPQYQWPSPRMVGRKVWLRLREFVVLSWPLLIAGSVVLGLADYWHWNRYVNAALSPLTSLLGLPLATGTTLVFGLLRKELSMIMLGQALGTPHISTVMTSTQILVFTIFVAFYVPCLATIAALVREIGRKLTGWVLAYSMAVATVLALTARVISAIIFPH